MQMAARVQSGDDETDESSAEALGAEPGPVKFHVTVMAAFDLGHTK
jgi:hypothetical protein